MARRRRAARRLKLILYGRAWCHLCHDMQAQLEALREAHGFDLEVVDVDADEALEERLGDLIPVLEHEGRELARYRLDTAAFTAWLSGQIGRAHV